MKGAEVCHHSILHDRGKEMGISPINSGPPLIIHNLYVKFKSDRTKTAVCIVPARFHT